MWIRTECGELLQETTTDCRWYWNKKIGLCEMGNGYVMDKRNKMINFTKSGDNLIDVLEVDDTIISKHPIKPNKFIITAIDKKLNEVVCDSWRIKESYIKQVITHEQYMPLAQEVK